MSSFQFEQPALIRPRRPAVPRQLASLSRSLRRTASDSASLQPCRCRSRKLPSHLYLFRFSSDDGRRLAAISSSAPVLAVTPEWALPRAPRSAPIRLACRSRCAKRYRVPERERNLKLKVSDSVDGTPVVDIKTVFLPFAEALPWTPPPAMCNRRCIAEMPVSFLPLRWLNSLRRWKGVIRSYGHLFAMLAQDPRPAYRKGGETAKKPMPSGWLILTCAGVWLTPDLKRLRWNHGNFTPFFDISCTLVNPLNHFCIRPTLSLFDRSTGTVTTCVLANTCSPLPEGHLADAEVISLS